jgi:acetylcholinesterase
MFTMSCSLLGFSAYKRGKATPIAGAAHGTDLAEFYGVGTEPDFIGADALSE